MVAIETVAILVLVLSVALLGGATGLAWSLRRELQELRGKVGEVRGELVGLRTDVGIARAEVGEVRQDLGGVREQVERVEGWVVRGAPPLRDGRH